MENPPTIKEADGTRWTVENARPLIMRIGIGFVAPIVLGLIAITMVNDVREGRLGMMAVRGLFALFVVVAAIFSLFGGESLAVENGELVWRRGKSQVRRAAVGDVEKLERQGNHLRVHVRGQEQPIVVGAGLRQQPAAIAWLAERVQAALVAARKP
ncbi:MAG TPA: hypothetical protein VN947_03050 [Polyangia bacterium]|nr:hypothetical protein [Polyangia bacterium]